ncbi:MAG: peptidylprolyl isomerase, partial [Bacteroidales bacterium]
MLKQTFILSILLLSLFSQRSYAQSNVIDEVIWVVGDEAILKSQVEEQRMRMQYEGERINGDPYCVLPEQMAIQKLFLHQAKLDSIIVPESQVLMQVEMRMNYFISQIGSKEKLEEYFGKSYSQIRDEMKTMVRDQSTVQEMQKSLVGSVKVTPSEVRRFFTKLPEDSIPFIPTQVQVQILQLEPKVPQDEVDEIKSRLREYSDRVNNGGSEFSTL